MAQGNFKLKSKAPARVTKRQSNPKRCSPRIIKPKKTSLTSKITKSQRAKINNNTEQLVAARVGHLELLKGTKKDLKK